MTARSQRNRPYAQERPREVAEPGLAEPREGADGCPRHRQPQDAAHHASCRSKTSTVLPSGRRRGSRAAAKKRRKPGLLTKPCLCAATGPCGPGYGARGPERVEALL